MTGGLGLPGHYDACDSPSTENQRLMIICEIRDDIFLRRGETDGLRGGEESKLFAVSYALRLMNVYITDVALKKNCLFR